MSVIAYLPLLRHLPLPLLLVWGVERPPPAAGGQWMLLLSQSTGGPAELLTRPPLWAAEGPPVALGEQDGLCCWGLS